MKLGSLCSGYEGLGMAVQAVIPEAELAWVSDIDQGACKVLAHRYPDVPNLGDFTKTDWATVEPVEVLTAGFPCQPVSGAGKQLGDMDERWLWDDVARAIGELGPGLVVLENVRGLLTAGSGRLFGRVLGTLADLGYDAQWTGLRAAEVGAPHGRWRVFIVAHPHSAGRREQRWPVAARPEHTSLEHQGSLLPTPRTSDTNGAGQHGDGGLDLRTAVSLLPTPAVNDMGEGKTIEAWDAWTARMKAEHSNGNGHGPSLAIEAMRLLPTPNVQMANGSQTHRSGARTDELLIDGIVAANAWGQYADAIHRWETLTRPAPPPTETGTKGSSRLSPAFSEWMMGLPVGHVTDVPGITRNEALKLCGNGVVPQQGAAAIALLLDRAFRTVAA